MTDQSDLMTARFSYQSNKLLIPVIDFMNHDNLESSNQKDDFVPLQYNENCFEF